MAEAVALVGLAAAVAQFIEYGMKLADRLEELSSSTSDRANAFSALKARLPAVLGVLGLVKRQIERGVFDVAEAKTLLPIIENTNAHVSALIAVMEKIAPSQAKKKESLVVKYFTAMRSLSLDAEVQKITARLQGNLQIISLFQTTSLVEAKSQTTNSRPLSPQDTGNRSDVSTSQRQEPRLGEDAGVVIFSSSPQASAFISGADGLDLQVTVSQPNSNSASGFCLPDLSSTSTPDSVATPDLSKDGAVTPLLTDRCSSSCSCVRHRPYQLSTPSFLTNLVGHLAVNYAGEAFVKLPCSERRCRRSKESAARVTYRFPSWAWNRVVHMALSSTALNTKVNLNTMRILPDSAEVFAVISKGDVDRLRHMFKSGQASIYDVSRTNWTLIHTAFTLGRADMCQFLIAEGADLTIDAANRSNVIERAWFLAQKSSKIPGDYVMCDNEILREVDLDEFVSSQQYNLIHKIVLGITKLKLGEILESSTADIDSADVRGSTALWWASAQGNIPAVRTLLENGANHSIAATISQTALHVAGNAEVVRLLLQYGAEINSRDTAGRTPLHCYCYRQVGASPSIVRAILEAGAIVDAVASSGQTPLHYTTMFGNASLIPVLLEYGADIDAVKDDGMTPLMAGVRFDQHETVKCLLNSHADCGIVNKAQQNILHLASIHAGPECLNVLASANIGQLDADARDASGHSPLEHFENRRFRDEELDAAFLHLLRTVGHGNKSDLHVENEDEDEDSTGACDTQGSTRPEYFSMPGSFSQG